MTAQTASEQIHTTLSAQFGPRIVALLDTPEKQQAVHRAFRLIAAREGEAVARAWLIGMNPQLDDRAPILAVADGRLAAVESAMHAYLDGSAQ